MFTGQGVAILQPLPQLSTLPVADAMQGNKHRTVACTPPTPAPAEKPRLFVKHIDNNVYNIVQDKRSPPTSAVVSAANTHLLGAAL